MKLFSNRLQKGAASETESVANRHSVDMLSRDGNEQSSIS